MSRPLRVLILEDHREDADLMLHELRKADFDPTWERVEDEPEFLAHLAPELDLILADYHLPQFDALRALGLLKESGLDIPFIVVTGTISEEAAVAIMKMGAVDYLLKDRLARLGPAAVAAIEKKRLRDQKRRFDIALNENERLYRALFQNAPIGLGLLDTEGRFLALNEALLAAAGYSLEEASQLSDVAALFEDLPEAQRILQIFRQKRSVRQATARLQRKDGTGYDTLMTVTPVVLGGRECMQLMVEDITERKQAEMALRESEERYRTLFNEMPVGIYRASIDGRILEANPALAALFGYDSPGNLIGTNARDLYADPEGQLQWSQSVARDGVLLDAEIRVRRKDGLLLWALDRGRTVRDKSGRPIYFEGTLSDITERKGAEERLRESEAALRRAQQVAHVGSWVWHVEENRVEWSEELMRVFGLDQAALSGDMSLVIAAAVHPEDREAVARANEALLREQRPLPMEYRILRSDGQVRTLWAEAGDLILDDAGRPAVVTGIVQDITEHKQAEKSLRESEERYRAVIHSASDAIVSFDSAGTIVGWNPGAERMFGYGESELRGQPLMRLLPAHYLPGYLAEMERLGTGGETQMPGRTLEAQGLRKDGQGFPLEMSLSKWQVGNTVYFTAIIRDVTERKHADELLRQHAAEMEALYQTSLEILARNDLPDLLVAVVENVARLTGSDRGVLFLPTADGSRIRVHISHNMRRDYVGTEFELGEGLAGQAAEERRAIAIEDYDVWEGRSPKFSEEGIGRMLAVPMQVGERLIGVLNVADSNSGSYGAESIRLASLFADQAAMAIESARLVSESNRRSAYLEALTDTAAALRAAVEPQEMYGDILGHVVDQLEASGAALALVDPENGGTQVVLAVGTWEGTTGTRLSPGEGIIGMVTSSGRTFVSNDIRSDPRLARPEPLRDLPAVACAPLTVEDRIVGCVMVGRIEPLRAEEVQLLTGLGEISGSAIYRLQMMETLETRVRQRTLELEAANKRLQELDRLKNDFVSNVTHELRTPITNMLLYLDLARRTSSEPKRAHYFDVLKSESVRLGTLIESVLTMSRLERGMVPMDLEPHPLDALLADVLVGCQARAEAKGIVLDHEPDESLPVAWVNRAQMHQVLTNLMGNAVAYTPPGGQVCLRTARTQVGGRDYVGAVIHNTGTVIPPQEMRHLFERFYRGRVGRESGEPGTGLGLAISREIVELHHGWIDVESSEQAGTTFTAWLPSTPQA
jgi:PAS domain S-box-containing protein